MLFMFSRIITPFPRTTDAVRQIFHHCRLSPRVDVQFLCVLNVNRLVTIIKIHSTFRISPEAT